MNKIEEKIDKLIHIAEATRTPISCNVEITQNCNFKCPHCYIPNNAKGYLAYEQFTHFIDQFQSAGGLFLCLTGGETLLHPDFHRIYTYAHRKGLAVTVFTNGSLLNEQIFNLFKSLPPRKIEISIYGATRQTYRAVTNYGDAFLKVMNNVDTLIRNGCKVYLKTTVFRHNYLELVDIKRLAEERQVPFEYDFKLMPKRNHDKSNLIYQITPQQAIAMELEENTGKFENWRRQYPADEKDRIKDTDFLFKCGAARYSCFLSSSNRLRICAFATFSEKNMNTVSFQEAWSKYEDYNRWHMNLDSKCVGCDKIRICDICPIWGYMAYDDEVCLGKETDLHCSFADERIRVISDM